MNGTDTITETYAYDMFGNRTVTTDALGNAVYKSYDPFGRVIAEWGATYPVRHAYDTQGRRTSLATTRDGETWDETTWTYDPRTGLCTSKTYADGSTVTYTYTPDNQLLRTTYDDGTWRENIYDNSRRVVGEQSSDGSLDSAREYNLLGQMVMETNACAMATYARSATGNVTNIVQGVDSVTDIRDVQYDPHSRRTAFGGTLYGYAHDGKLASVSNAHAFVEYLYDGDRQNAGYTLTLSNGAVFCRSVSRHPYLRHLATNIVNSVNGIAIDSLFYTYDALNRPIFRNADAFAYNVRSEVTNAIFHSPFSIFHSYGYDSIGNSTNHEANCLNQYVQFTYDARGNMTQCGEWIYVYDSGNRLVAVTSNGLPVASFAYDSQGRRVKKVAADGTHRYFFDGWLLIREHLTRPDNTVSETQYCWGTDLSGTLQGAGGVGGLLYLERDGAIYVPTYDNNGNVSHYCDAQGNVVASYTYDAFGNLIAQSGPMADDFTIRFSTKYYDREIGLYYYGYRYYCPILMRWLNRDPIEEDGGVNLYAFCSNVPLLNCDKLGLSSFVFIYDSSDPMFKTWAEDSRRRILSNSATRYGSQSIRFDPKKDTIHMVPIMGIESIDGLSQYKDVKLLASFGHGAGGKIWWGYRDVVNNSVVTGIEGFRLNAPDLAKTIPLVKLLLNFDKCGFVVEFYHCTSAQGFEVDKNNLLVFPSPTAVSPKPATPEGGASVISTFKDLVERKYPKTKFSIVGSEAGVSNGHPWDRGWPRPVGYTKQIKVIP